MAESNILVFDIETVVDIAGARKILDLKAASDDEVLKIVQGERLAEANSLFPKLHLHKIACISVFIAKDNGEFILTTLGRDDSEAVILKRFFTAIEKFNPVLVSWNGKGFDVPVINYRSLINGVSSKDFYDCESQSKKWNNYHSRYHNLHLDLMDFLSSYNQKAFAKLDEIAKLCGLPGKLGVDGSKVQEFWDSGKKEEIFDYCETDVLNTYGIYLRFELMRGNLSAENYSAKVKAVTDFLNSKSQKHLQEYLKIWNEND